MNRVELILRARNLVRDISASFFRDVDVINYLNEGIERIKQVIPELSEMPTLDNSLDEVTYLPNHWHHLISIYAAARLCTQDERHYQAGTFMNEFEIKLDNLIDKIKSGDVILKDPDGNVVDIFINNDYVVNLYFDKNKSDWGD